MGKGWSLHRDTTGAGRKLPEVIVVGAGISGLLVARLLRDTGFPVVVMEGRDRIGGRIWTDTSLGAPCDLGASWLHNARKNPLSKWCRRKGVSLLRSPARRMCLVNGRPVSLRRIQWIARRPLLRAVCSLICMRARARLCPGGSRPDGNRSLADVLGDLVIHGPTERLDSRAMAWLVSMVESIYGAPSALLSATELDPIELLFSDNLVPKGGYGQLIEDAAEGLDIHTGTRVSCIQYDADGVIVHTTRGTFRGALAVVTVPLGVLKASDIRFDPPLPPSKRSAIERIGYGEGAVLDKLVLRFRKRKWPGPGVMIGTVPRVADCRGGFPVWADLGLETGQPIIVGFASGQLGASWDLEAQEEKVVEAGLAVLRDHGLLNDEQPLAFGWTRWLADPFSRGAYSFRAYGSDASDRKALAMPVGRRLFFAGEATHHSLYGTVDGALLSAEREALRIHGIYCCDEAETSRLPWR